jgi:hypothetical protein
MLNKPALLFYCPVPIDQRPLNEYLELKQSFLFDWPASNINEFLKKILLFSFFILIFSVPITNYFYPLFDFPKEFFLINLIININCLIILLIRIQLGWSYIEKRLLSPTIEYEESGWYDGQIWVKPIKILKQDRLIYSYKVYPILQRVKNYIIYCLLTAILIFLFTFLF